MELAESGRVGERLEQRHERAQRVARLPGEPGPVVDRALHDAAPGVELERVPVHLERVVGVRLHAQHRVEGHDRGVRAVRVEPGAQVAVVGRTVEDEIAVGDAGGGEREREVHELVALGGLDGDVAPVRRPVGRVEHRHGHAADADDARPAAVVTVLDHEVERAAHGDVEPQRILVAHEHDAHGAPGLDGHLEHVGAHLGGEAPGVGAELLAHAEAHDGSRRAQRGQGVPRGGRSGERERGPHGGEDEGGEDGQWGESHARAPPPASGGSVRRRSRPRRR